MRGFIVLGAILASLVGGLFWAADVHSSDPLPSIYTQWVGR